MEKQLAIAVLLGFAVYLVSLLFFKDKKQTGQAKDVAPTKQVVAETPAVPKEVPPHIVALADEVNALHRTPLKEMNYDQRSSHLEIEKIKLKQLVEELDSHPYLWSTSVDTVIDEFNVKYAELKKETAKSETKTSALVAVVDTETTGLTQADQVISVAAILYEVKMPIGTLVSEVDSYYGLREPSVPISRGAWDVHKITIDQLIDKRLDIEKLTSIISKADIVVAHNAKFDRRMLTPIVPGIRNKTWACSMLALRDYWKELPGRSLDVICDAFEINRPNPHHAMDDCRALAEVLFNHSGKTKRSKTFMGHLVARPWAPDGD